MKKSAMLHRKRRPWTACSATLSSRGALLLLLVHCCGAQFQVVGPQQPVVVTIGDDATLPCRLQPATDATALTFEWARLDLSPRFVHVWHKGRDLHSNQYPSFKGRTSVSVQRLQHGDVSLTLSQVKLSDEGTYRCYFPDSNTHSTVQLVVGTASWPGLRLSGLDRARGGVVLHCQSGGWNPEPEVSWLDGEGNLLSAGPAETARGPDDLYTVSSRVTVEKRRNNSFTCRVHQKTSNQTREAHLSVPVDFYVGSCSSAARLAVSAIAGVAALLAAAACVWRFRRNEREYLKVSQTESQKMEKKEKEQEDLVEELTEVKEKLEKKEKEHEDLVDLLRRPTEELRKQRDQLTEQWNEMERLREKTEERLQSVEGDKQDRDKLKRSQQQCVGLKEIISNYKWNLNERQEALHQIKIDSDKLIEESEKMIQGTTATKQEETPRDHQRPLETARDSQRPPETPKTP